MFSAALLGTATARPTLTVEGTDFVLTASDGRTLRSPDLQGATLKIKSGGRNIEVTIKSVEADPHAVGGPVTLHHLVSKDESGRSVDLCAGDAQGRSLGFPVPDGQGGFDLTCTSGAVGKCVRWGYRPWEEKPDGPPLRALHQACIHMTRADYGGDGRATTRDGTLIDLYDRFGIQKADRDPSTTFEAAWGVSGAICVARPRIPENVSLEELGERYPKLKQRLGATACTEEVALADPGALLFNRSRE